MKERQFSLPNDSFLDLDFTNSLMDEPFRVLFSQAFSSFYNTDRPLFGHSQNVLYDEDRARNFNISALLCKRRRLLAALLYKERSVVELKAFLAC